MQWVKRRIRGVKRLLAVRSNGEREVAGGVSRGSRERVFRASLMNSGRSRSGSRLRRAISTIGGEALVIAVSELQKSHSYLGTR